jgi:hypothetical protein
MRNARTPRKKTTGTSVRGKNESARVDRYVIKSVKGGPLRADLDNIGEVIAEVEGDLYR